MDMTVVLFVITLLTAVIIILLLFLIKQATALRNQKESRAEVIDKYILIDVQTGIYNERFLVKKLEEEIYRSARYNSHFALAIFDFTRILSRIEKEKAESIFRKIVASLSRDTRFSDISARYGEFGFAIVFTVTPKISAEVPVNRLLNKAEEILTRENLQGEPEIKVYGFPEDKTEIEKIVIKLKK